MNYRIVMPKCQILTDNGERLGCARRASIGVFRKPLVKKRESRRATPTMGQSAYGNRSGVDGKRANRGTRRVGELRSGHGALYLSRPRTRRPRFVVRRCRRLRVPGERKSILPSRCEGRENTSERSPLP